MDAEKFKQEIGTTRWKDAVDYGARRERQDWAREAVDDAEWITAWLRAGAPEFCRAEAILRLQRLGAAQAFFGWNWPSHEIAEAQRARDDA